MPAATSQLTDQSAVRHLLCMSQACSLQAMERVGSSAAVYVVQRLCIAASL